MVKLSGQNTKLRTGIFFFFLALLLSNYNKFPGSFFAYFICIQLRKGTLQTHLYGASRNGAVNTAVCLCGPVTEVMVIQSPHRHV